MSKIKVAKKRPAKKVKSAPRPGIVRVRGYSVPSHVRAAPKKRGSSW